MIDNMTRDKYTLDALAKVYISLHIFDLVEDKLFPLKSNEHIEKWSEGFESCQEKLRNVMKQITVEEHQDMIMQFIDFSTLEERMKGHDTIVAVFRGKVSGWCKVRFIRVHSEADEKLRYVLYAVECIDEEKKKENQLVYLSQTDLMTGIYNRGFGEKTISELLEKERKGLFCLFDIDKLKNVNDKYGHIVGDKVLIAVAEALKSVQRPDDVIMRLGGDEFAAYFADVDSGEKASEIISHLFDEIAKIHIAPMANEISVSLGAVMYRSGLTFDLIYKLADKGVYDSKNCKGNTYTFQN